jgi:hypothetical protein
MIVCVPPIMSPILVLVRGLATLDLKHFEGGESHPCEPWPS